MENIFGFGKRGLLFNGIIGKSVIILYIMDSEPNQELKIAGMCIHGNFTTCEICGAEERHEESSHTSGLEDAEIKTQEAVFDKQAEELLRSYEHFEKNPKIDPEKINSILKEIINSECDSDNRKDLVSEIYTKMSKEFESFAKTTQIREAVNKEINDNEKINSLFAHTVSPSGVIDKKLLARYVGEEYEFIPVTDSALDVFPKQINESNQMNCSGRALYASKFLSEMGIEHYVCSPESHSSLLLKNPENENYIYFDPQFGVLMDVPNDSLKILGDIDRIGIASIDVKKCLMPRFQAFRAVDTKFLIASPEVGASQQMLGNVVPLYEQIGQTNNAEAKDQIGKALETLFPELYSDGPDFVPPFTLTNVASERIPQLIQLYKNFSSQEIGQNWEVNEEVLEYVKYNNLFPIVGETQAQQIENLQKIIEQIKSWESEGEDDVVASNLAKITGKKNVKGANLNYFFQQ